MFRTKTFLTLTALLVSPLLLLWGGQAHGLSASEVENNVLGGRQTIINWERDRWNEIRDCHNHGDYGGNHRTCVNRIAYMNWMWIMAKGGNTNVVEVDAGAHEVTLRVKTLLFYTSAVVSPTGAWDWYDYGSQWVVREDNFPNDRAPNFFTSDCGHLTTTGVNCPALNANYYQVNNAWVDNNPAGAYVKSFDSSIKDSGVSKTTRYQFTPDSDLVIRSESGFVADQDITVHISYKRARHYYNQGWVVCDSGGSLAHVNNASQCPADTTSAVIKVKVKAPVVEAIATVDNPQNNNTMAQTRKDSLGNGSGKVEINAKAMAVGNGQQAVMTGNRPGQRLTWWFGAENKGPGPTLNTFDMMNFRAGWGNSDWDIDNFNDTNKVNWFQPPTIQQGQTYQYGCYDWGKTCTHNGSTLSVSQAEARKFSYVIGSNDVGKTLCQRTRLSWNEGYWREVITPNACAYIPYHYPSCDPNKNDCDHNPPKDCHWNGTCPNQTVSQYGVVPSVQYVGDGTVMMGETVKFNYSVTNRSSYTKTKNMNYRAYIFVLRGGEVIATADGARSYNTNVAICNGSGAQSARGINAGQVRTPAPCRTPLSGSVSVNAGSTWNGGQRSIVLNSDYSQIQPGDQICSYLTLDNWNVINDQSSPSQVASNVACVRVGKRPQIQISGADSYAAGGFTGTSFVASSSLPGGEMRGSYSQYGLMTGSGRITNFGSAGYTTTNAGNANLACKLSYANNSVGIGNNSCNGASQLGMAKLQHQLAMPDVQNAKTLSSSNVNLASLSSGTYKYDGTLQISGTPASGVSLVIVASNGVKITGNTGISETTRYGSLGDIPSVTIIANSGDIAVDSGVTYVAANLVARQGRFVSCANSTNSDLGITGKCGNKLKINGSVITKQGMQLYRTFGGGNNTGVNQSDGARISTTSEWFNYTPNLYLVAADERDWNLPTDFRVTTMTTLPARY